MKKFTLLLTVSLMVSAVPVSAQARTIDKNKVLNAMQIVKQIQTIKGDKETVTRNILRSLGIDIDKYNIPKATACPTKAPTAAPTVKPTQAPTAKPTAVPTQTPTAKPTNAPTQAPTAVPTQAPTERPTVVPTQAPTAVPTAKPTQAPTAKPTAAPAVNGIDAMEEEVLRLVNEERAKAGVAPLTRAKDLDALARAHSQDMINRHFFDHNNPDGQSPFDRMRAAGISYRAAAENIAYGQRSAQAVMDAWMNSSGHRKNILNGTYTEIGIGAVKNSGGTIYWTQEFVKR